jgi:hypothetical protein
MKIINWCKENYVFLAILLLAFLLRIFRLDYQSPWADELFTLINSHSGKSLSDIFSALKGDVHPPLYYYIVHLFLEIFGDSAYAARFVSLLFGIGGIVAVYYLGKEIFNKSVALTAIFLLSVNHFHIFYSQEARMYSMLFFTTTLSFLFLIRFIKLPTLKSALQFSLCAALLINTHFYSVFALFAIYLIILYYIIKPYNTTGKKMFFYALLSGIITVVSFIPSMVIFLSTSGLKSFWITAPSWDVYTSMFKELIGSEIGVTITTITILYFIYTIFKQGELVTFKIDPEQERPVFAFQVLFIWIFICVILPYILSYIHIPMVISRYFINLLPAIFLLMAAGIGYIGNSSVKVTIVGVFILFSLSDLILVKEHYKRFSKTQYRHASNFIEENYKKDEKIFSCFGNYFSYFLQESEGYTITNGSLNPLVGRIINNEERPESFWYIDIIDNNTGLPSESTTTFLDSLYVIDKSADLHDAVVKHYQSKKSYKPTSDFTKFKPYKDRNGSDISFSFEIFNDLGTTVEISGWAFFNTQSSKHSKISLVLIDDKKDVALITKSIKRDDVTSYFKSEYDLSNSGFEIVINKKDLDPGNYKVAIYLTDSETKKEALVIIADKIISK